jgi:hypothetical protein
LMLTPASKPAAGRSDSWSDRWPESMTEVSSGHLLRPSVVPCGGGHRHRSRFIGLPAVVEVGYPLADWLA